MPPPISSLSLMASSPIPSPPATVKPGSSRVAPTVSPCNSSSPPSTSSSSCHATAVPVTSTAGRRGLLALGAGFMASAAVLCPAGEAGATRIEYYATVGEKLCDLTMVQSGLGYCDVAVGTGVLPKRFDLINVHYTARFPDGTVFDSSYKRGRPLTMRIGAGKILRGLQQGIAGGGGVPPMLVGGKRKLMIPPILAYGPEPAGCFSGDCNIPGNSTLLYDILLVGIYNERVMTMNMQDLNRIGPTPYIFRPATQELYTGGRRREILVGRDGEVKWVNSPTQLKCAEQGSICAEDNKPGYLVMSIMATSTSQHALISIKPRCAAASVSSEKRTSNVRFVSAGSCCPGSRKLGLVCSSNSQSSVIDPVQLPASPNSASTPKKSSESALILIRHGESLWNEKNLFTGCVDVPLTPKGVNEAIEAGKRICNIPVDVIYTSSLIRAQMTAMLAMMQHRRKKVPIIVHNESERAHQWSQVCSEETKKQSIPVITAWELNERMYGELQGLNKQETADRFGKEQVHEWRRSYDIPPPNGESLEMCAERAVAYFKDQVVPQLVAGKHVMIAAHGNSLRSIIMHLDKLTSQEVISLELSTGIPMLYIFKEGKFIRRGSPAGPSEAGVYAYTRSLAQYRQKLDGMSQ